MKGKLIAAALVMAIWAVPAFSDGMPQGGASKEGGATPPQLSGQAPHKVQGGETMWSISGRYLNDRKLWPLLWSFNPQVRNPHWLFPGDSIFLGQPPPQPELGPVIREVRLVVETLVPQPTEAEKTAAAQASAAATAGEEAARAEPKGPMISLLEDRSQDYLTAAPGARVGVLGKTMAIKNLSAAEEEVEFEISSGAKVAPDDLLTSFDDSRIIYHPITNEPFGRQVRVTGHMKVLRVNGGRGWAQVFRSYDALEDGQGLMPYKEPIRSVEARSCASAKDGGIVIAGGLPVQLLTNDAIVFLSIGSAEGLSAGCIIDVPYPVSPAVAEGYTDKMDMPIARAVVISTQEKSSTALILESRKAVEAGFRFVAAADSP